MEFSNEIGFIFYLSCFSFPTTKLAHSLVIYRNFYFLVELKINSFQLESMLAPTLPPQPYQ